MSAPDDAQCICPREDQSLGKLDGFDMGRGMARVDTAEGCPVHDSCHGYTAAIRQDRYRKRKWDRPWCPIHGVADCPAGGAA